MLKRKNSGESRSSKASESSSELRESSRRPKFSFPKAFRKKSQPSQQSPTSTPTQEVPTTLPLQYSPATSPIQELVVIPIPVISTTPGDKPPPLPSTSPPTPQTSDVADTKVDFEVTTASSQDLADTHSHSFSSYKTEEDNLTEKVSTSELDLEESVERSDKGEKLVNIKEESAIIHTFTKGATGRRRASTSWGTMPTSMNYSGFHEKFNQSEETLDDTSDFDGDDEEDAIQRAPKNRKGSLPSIENTNGFNRCNQGTAYKTLPTPQPKGKRVKQNSISVKYVRVHGPEDGAYKNDSKPRGLIFMKNIERFDDSSMYSFRKGSSEDYDNLLDLFQQMGYRKSQKYCESGHIKKAKLLDDLKAFSKLDHSVYDSCIIILMSHGVQDKTFVCSDGEQVNLMDVYSLLNNTNCQHLRNKPKIFIFQFCRPQTTLPMSRGLPSSRHFSLSCAPGEADLIEFRIKFAVEKMAEQLRQEFRTLLTESFRLMSIRNASSNENEADHSGLEALDLSSVSNLALSPHRRSLDASYFLSTPGPMSTISRNSSGVFTYDTPTLVADAAKLETANEDVPAPDYSDMYSIFSTNSGGIAYRHPRKGSLLIQAICHVFSSHAYQDDIEELVRKVSKWMQQEIVKDDPMASTRHTVVERVNNGLDKAFYFNPFILKNTSRYTTSYW